MKQNFDNKMRALESRSIKIKTFPLGIVDPNNIQ